MVRDGHLCYGGSHDPFEKLRGLASVNPHFFPEDLHAADVPELDR